MAVELLNVDCMEYMSTQPGNAFDLAIVDPPYGIGASEKNSTDKRQSKNSEANSTAYGGQRWDDAIPCKDYFEELKRVSRKQIIWGANYFGLTGGMLYWHKNVTMPTYSTGEIAFLSWLKKIDFVELTWHGMLQPDMRNKEHRIHPTQKPVKLYQWLLAKYAKPGQRILDTHLGSGSSAIAAHYAGCDFVGCEIDEDYYRAAVARFDDATRQLALFE